jgi:hypothetical protein
MKQTKTDSFLESLTNILVRAPINMAANTVVFPAMGYQITLVQNFSFMVFFTCVSLIVSYSIRRLFNGRSIYQVIRNRL